MAHFGAYKDVVSIGKTTVSKTVVLGSNPSIFAIKVREDVNRTSERTPNAQMSEKTIKRRRNI